MPKREAINLEAVTLKTKKDETITGAVIIGAMFWCTRCKSLKPAMEFGLRVSNGIVRNQAQCSQCR